MNKITSHLLGYLTQRQVEETCKMWGTEQTREIMKEAGWEDCYNWGEEQ